MRQRKRYVFIFLILTFLLFLLPTGTYAKESEDSENSVFIQMSINGNRLHDFSSPKYFLSYLFNEEKDTFDYQKTEVETKKGMSETHYQIDLTAKQNKSCTLKLVPNGEVLTGNFSRKDGNAYVWDITDNGMAVYMTFKTNESYVSDLKEYGNKISNLGFIQGSKSWIKGHKPLFLNILVFAGILVFLVIFTAFTVLTFRKTIDNHKMNEEIKRRNAKTRAVEEKMLEDMKKEFGPREDNEDEDTKKNDTEYVPVAPGIVFDGDHEKDNDTAEYQKNQDVNSEVYEIGNKAKENKDEKENHQDSDIYDDDFIENDDTLGSEP